MRLCAVVVCVWMFGGVQSILSIRLVSFALHAASVCGDARSARLYHPPPPPRYTFSFQPRGRAPPGVNFRR